MIQAVLIFNCSVSNSPSLLDSSPHFYTQQCFSNNCEPVCFWHALFHFSQRHNTRLSLQIKWSVILVKISMSTSQNRDFSLIIYNLRAAWKLSSLRPHICKTCEIFVLWIATKICTIFNILILLTHKIWKKVLRHLSKMFLPFL